MKFKNQVFFDDFCREQKNNLMKTILNLGIVMCISVFFACGENKQQASDAENSVSERSIQSTGTWHGTYRGVLPCANCEGIRYELKLNEDLSYEMARKYLGKEDKIFRNEGTFTWDESGNKITLLVDNEEKELYQFEAKEDQLVKLSVTGEPIDEKLQSVNSLVKNQQNESIRNRYWKLTHVDQIPIIPSENKEDEAHLILRSDSQKAFGYSGCNQFSGKFHNDESSRIRFSTMIATKKACDHVKYESTLFELFETVDSYRVEQDTLFLMNKDNEQLIKFVAVYLMD